MEIEKQRLAEIVRNRRTKKGFTQAELSDKTGISLRSIQRIEKGEVLPRSFTITALASTLEFSLEDLNDSIEETSPKTSERAKKIILSSGSIPVIILLALAFLFQSSTFPENTFELSLFWAAVIFIIGLIQWFIWTGKKR